MGASRGWGRRSYRSLEHEGAAPLGEAQHAPGEVGGDAPLRVAVGPGVDRRHVGPKGRGAGGHVGRALAQQVGEVGELGGVEGRADPVVVVDGVEGRAQLPGPVRREAAAQCGGDGLAEVAPEGGQQGGAARGSWPLGARARRRWAASMPEVVAQHQRRRPHEQGLIHRHAIDHVEGGRRIRPARAEMNRRVPGEHQGPVVADAGSRSAGEAACGPRSRSVGWGGVTDRAWPCRARPPPRGPPWGRRSGPTSQSTIAGDATTFSKRKLPGPMSLWTSADPVAPRLRARCARSHPAVRMRETGDRHRGDRAGRDHLPAAGAKLPPSAQASRPCRGPTGGRWRDSAGSRRWSSPVSAIRWRAVGSRSDSWSDSLGKSERPGMPLERGWRPATRGRGARTARHRHRGGRQRASGWRHRERLPGGPALPALDLSHSTRIASGAALSVRRPRGWPNGPTCGQRDPRLAPAKSRVAPATCRVTRATRPARVASTQACRIASGRSMPVTTAPHATAGNSWVDARRVDVGFVGGDRRWASCRCP